MESGSHYIEVDDIEWQATQFEGIEMKLLYQDSNGAMTAMFRFQPGARLPRHRHTGIEQTFVLEGSLVDDQGACTAGNYVWRDPGSIHAAHSPNGCVSIGIFQSANEFIDDAENG